MHQIKYWIHQIKNKIVPPKITPFEFARDVNVGDRVSVQCVVGTGDLPLTFAWMKDDQLISSNNIEQKSRQLSITNDVNNPIMIRQNDEFTSALSISAITRNQGGTYKCIVENDAAKETYSALLRVNGKKKKCCILICFRLLHAVCEWLGLFFCMNFVHFVFF